MAAKKNDSYEQRAGKVGAALAILGTPEAFEHHAALVQAERDIEAALAALEAGKVRAAELHRRAIATHDAFVHVLATMPELGTYALRMAEPPPILSEFERWDPDVRCAELVEWLARDPRGAPLAQHLDELRVSVRAARADADQGAADYRALALAHTAARYALKTKTAECEFYIRLHEKVVPQGKEAKAAITFPRPSRRKASLAAATPPVAVASIAAPAGSVATPALAPASPERPREPDVAAGSGDDARPRDAHADLVPRRAGA